MGRERCPYKTKMLFENKPVWKALKEEYLTKMDPTEYLFATESEILDGGATGDKWKHWEMITKSYYCKKDVLRWREELEAKMKALGIRNAIASAVAEKGFTASKWLAESGWKEKVAGRPTKREKERQARIEANVTDEIDELLDTMQEDKRRTTLQ